MKACSCRFGRMSRGFVPPSACAHKIDPVKCAIFLDTEIDIQMSMHKLRGHPGAKDHDDDC
jgi:hypothetical protein